VKGLMVIGGTYIKYEMSKDKLKKFWLKKSKEYEISEWSADFNDLGRN